MRKKISAVVAISMMATNVSPILNVYADEVVKEKAKIIEESVVNSATISNFKLRDYSNFEGYNQKYRINRDEIVSISNNGGQYSSSSIDKAIDGDLSTHWETGKVNTSDFKNEVVVEFENIETIDRMAYATRQDGAKGKGYPTEFEIYASLTGKDEDFKLVSTGSNQSTSNLMEFKFDATTAKKIKFVFKEANQGWASASEFWFYKEDKLINKLGTIFTDDNLTEVSEEFNTIEKLNAFEKEVSNHPFYEEFKGYIENAKLVLEGNVVEYKNAIINTFKDFNDEALVKYNELFKINASKISTNGGHYGSSNIEKAIDGDRNTSWHSGKQNSNEHTNEVIITLDNLETLDRVVYTSLNSRGFAKAFDIYTSKTTTGDSFEKVTSGSMDITKNSMEIKFNPTQARRVKFVFKEGYENWALASEFALYKEDTVKDKIYRLFTDENRNAISSEFNSLESLSELEKLASTHPFYNDFKESLEDAKKILEGNEVVFTNARVRKFKNFNDKTLAQYNEQYQIKSSKISTNGGHYGNSNVEKAIDGDINTSWHSGSTNSDTHTNEVVITLDNLETLDRVVYTSLNSRGFAKEFDIYTSKTVSGNTFEKVTSGTSSITRDSIEIKFNPTQARRVKFVYKNGHEGFALANEFALYKEDKLYDQIPTIFTDGLMDTLTENFDTLEELEAFENKAKTHPFYDDFKIAIERAKEILNNSNLTEERVVTAVQRGHYTTESGKRMINGGAYSSLESFGKYVTAGEEIVVYVDADPNGKLPELCFGQVGKGKGDWRRWAKLQPGKNVIKAPDNINPSAVYLVNHATPEEQAFAPRARIEGGTKFPTYFHGETDPQEFRKEVEEYAKKINKDDTAFENGNPKNEVYNIAEFVSENVVITTTALGTIEGLKWAEQQNLDISDTMTEWEKMYEHFQTFMGYEKDTTDEKNSYFPNKFVARVFYGVPLGFADHGYTGYLGSDNPERDGGFFKMIAAPPNMKGNDNWCYTHEFGHIFNTKYIVDGEVTNNLYAQEYRRLNADKGINENRANWDEIFKRFNGKNEEYRMHYFERLAVLSQLNIAYGYDAYAKASRAVRDNTELIKSIEGSDIQRLAVAYSIGLNVNLLDFFEGWNYAEIEITDQMKDTVKHLPKPDKKIEYLHSGAYDYKGNGFTEDIKVNVNSNLNKESKTVTLNFGVDKENKEDVLGYEILKDEKVIGFTKTNKFEINNVDVNDSLDYKVVAYAKDLSTAEPVNVRVTKPTLSIEENLTLDLGTKFNAKDYVKAQDYEGNLIEDIAIESNVDTSEKGNYEVKYTVNANESSESKVMKVKVVSKIVYASDVEETSAKVGWGAFRKDKAPNNTTIELDRQGVVTAYPKGLGAHADSEVVYNLEGKGYEKFESYVGIDKSMENNGSASFKVYLDDKMVYDSGVMNAAMDHEFVSIELGDAKELKLITEDHGNNSADQTVWADAKFIINNVKPVINIEDAIPVKLNSEFDLRDGITAIDAEDGDLTDSIQINAGNFTTSKTGKYTVEYTVTDSDNNTVTKSRDILVYSGHEYASDLKYTIQKSGYGGIKNDKSPKNTAITVLVNGEETKFEKGIGAHANSEITFDLTEKKYEFFTSRIGLDGGERGNESASVKYKVIVDGEEVYESKVFKTNDDSEVINIPVNGAKEIKLITDQANQNDWSDQSVWADAKFLVTDSKPVIETKDIVIEKGQTPNLAENLTATDAEDGDLTSKIETVSNNFEANKLGRFEVVYRVTDNDENTSEKTRYITVYENLDVKKSQSLDKLNEYNEQFKLSVVSAKNNAGNYGGDIIDRAIDGDRNTHWETNSPNNEKFKNEVVFDLGESKDIARMSYKARNGGKGFATKFSVYVSRDAEGNDFILAGKGEYNGSTGDSINFKLNRDNVRRVKFVFDQAREGWASIGEMTFYGKDEVADKVEGLFTDSTKSEVTEEYNTLDKLNALREEVKSHVAKDLFQADFNKAEELIRASFPSLTIPKSQSVKIGETLDDLVGEVTASDTKDGDISSNVQVTGLDKVNFNRLGEYEITYFITDSDNNTVSKSRKISVVDMEDYEYLSDFDWKSANSGWGKVQKDNSVSSNGLRLTNENGEEQRFEKGIGTHSTSIIVYDLSDKNYERFSSFVGVDRAMHGSPGSVQFEVYVDGDKAYDSGVMNSRDTMKFVDLDIADAKELKLVVKDGGNGIGSDHGNWADAKLHFVNEDKVDKSKLEELVVNK